MSKKLKLSKSVIVAMLFASIFVAAASYASITEPAAQAAPQSDSFPSFSSAWRNAGNATLPSTVGIEICGVIATPCPKTPQPSAEKYISTENSVVYLVRTTLGETNSTGYVSISETNLLVVNSHVYCIWTNSTDSRLALYNKCPEVINTAQMPNPLNQTFKLTTDNQDEFAIKYNMTNGAQLKNIKADLAAKTLILEISSAANDGELTIELPRQLIDAKFWSDSTSDCNSTDNSTSGTLNHCNSDVDFKINLSNGSTSGNNEPRVASIIENTPTARTLLIDYPKGDSSIRIQGTNIVPEFSFSILALVMAMAVIGMIAANSVNKRRQAL